MAKAGRVPSTLGPLETCSWLCKRTSEVGRTVSKLAALQKDTAGLCTHCLLCLRWSLCLFLFTFVHIKYTSICVPGLAQAPLCFFYFGAPFRGAAGGQALYILASSHCSPDPRGLLGKPPCREGRWYLLSVLTVSALTLSGNLNSLPNPPLPTSSII